MSAGLLALAGTFFKIEINSKIFFVKKVLLFFLLLFFSQVVSAQSLTGNEGMLGSSRTYRKVSGDSVRLRPSVVERMDKEEKQRAKAEAKAAKAKAKADRKSVV